MKILPLGVTKKLMHPWQNSRIVMVYNNSYTFKHREGHENDGDDTELPYTKLRNLLTPFTSIRKLSFIAGVGMGVPLSRYLGWALYKSSE